MSIGLKPLCYRMRKDKGGLEQHVRAMLTGPCGIRSQTSLVVAFSGGPDSTALLHLLARLRRPLELDLVAVWVDHQLRPLETPQEKRHVIQITENLALPLECYQVDTHTHAQQQGLSLEHAARTLRYALLRQTARTRGIPWIAVGHTADDQEEEILLRLLRGSGRKGLSGMRPCSQDIIRPLLSTPKAQLVQWLAQQGLTYCLDSSNQDRRFLRNRVRHELLPFLREQFDANIGQALRTSAANWAEDENILEDLTTEAWMQVLAEEGEGERKKILLWRQPYTALHPALQRRVAEKILWQLGSQAQHRHILLIVAAAATGRSSSELHLSQGLRLAVLDDRLEFSYPVGKQAWRGRLFPQT
jgi:tRNA(Ile)-lysidine synthase